MKKLKNALTWVYCIGFLAAVVLNITAWVCVEFCDWYALYVFPVWVKTYGKLTSQLSYSIGEIMLILAVGFTAFGISFFFIQWISRDPMPKWYQIYMKIYAWGLLAVIYIMTLNCFILYHTSDFSQKYLKNERSDYIVDASGQFGGEEEETSNYTKKNIAILRDYLVEQCNALAPTFPRDESNTVLYEGDLMQEAVYAMQDLSKEYEQLQGFFVTPKYLKFSGFFSQQSIMGYYFPFSLEANINSIMYITNVIPTVCHELAHTKGFLYENDANMISYLACIQSEDPFIQYCGYLSVLNYVNNDFYSSIGKNKKVYKQHIRIDDLVANDNVFLTKEDWKAVEKKAVIKTQTVKKVSKELMQASMKMNGVEQGIQQYSEVVNLLLDYYEGTLY